MLVIVVQIEFFLLNDTLVHSGDQQGFTCIFYTGKTLLDPETVTRVTQHPNLVIIPIRPDLQADTRTHTPRDLPTSVPCLRPMRAKCV